MWLGTARPPCFDSFMPLFKPILTAADLPKPGVAYEQTTLDAKGTKDKNPNLTAPKQARYDPDEMAKDVAALANTLGGTVLMGVTVPLFDGGARDAELKEADIDAEGCLPHLEAWVEGFAEAAGPHFGWLFVIRHR